MYLKQDALMYLCLLTQKKVPVDFTHLKSKGYIWEYPTHWPCFREKNLA